jgi:hypothetical protein
MRPILSVRTSLLPRRSGRRRDGHVRTSLLPRRSGRRRDGHVRRCSNIPPPTRSQQPAPGMFNTSRIDVVQGDFVPTWRWRGEIAGHRMHATALVACKAARPRPLRWCPQTSIPSDRALPAMLTRISRKSAPGWRRSSPGLRQRLIRLRMRPRKNPPWARPRVFPRAAA